MITTQLRTGIGEGFWDDLTLIVEGPVPQIIRMNDRDVGLDAARQLAIAEGNKHTGDLVVDIDGTAYTWNEKTWRRISSVLWQWVEEHIIYLIEEDIFKDADTNYVTN